MHRANLKALEGALARHLPPPAQDVMSAAPLDVSQVARALAEEGAVMAGALGNEDLGLIMATVAAIRGNGVPTDELIETLRNIAKGVNLPPGARAESPPSG